MNAKLSTENATIQFEATLVTISDWTILQVPEDESAKLSSRGQVSTDVTIRGHSFQIVLEPDGRWSHWCKVTPEMRATAGVKSGDTVTVVITQRSDWPEPTVPDDFVVALASAPDNVQAMWHDITPMARWEWIRWVNATREQSTRDRRVEVSISKMKSGKRRPCCFNLAACTDPDLSRSGRLMQPNDYCHDTGKSLLGSDYRLH